MCRQRFLFDLLTFALGFHLCVWSGEHNLGYVYFSACAWRACASVCPVHSEQILAWQSETIDVVWTCVCSSTRACGLWVFAVKMRDSSSLKAFEHACLSGDVEEQLVTEHGKAEE